MVGANWRCGTLGRVNRGLWLVASRLNFDDKKVRHVKPQKRQGRTPLADAGVSHCWDPNNGGGGGGGKGGEGEVNLDVKDFDA